MKGQCEIDPNAHLVPQMVLLAVRAFAVALDKMIQGGSDPMDRSAMPFDAVLLWHLPVSISWDCRKKLANMLRSNEFNFTLPKKPETERNLVYKFDGDGYSEQDIGLANLVNGSWRRIGIWDYATKVFHCF